MRRLFFAACLLCAAVTLRAEDQPRPATADEIALFKDAMQNSRQDTEHWAYTETTHFKATKGGMKGETIVRFDPSLPYGEQFKPLQVEGKPPTERQLKDYRKRGEKRGERVARAAQAAKDPAYVPPPTTLRVGGAPVVPDLEHPLVVRAEEGRLVFEVPVRSLRKEIPAEKFQVLVTVARPATVIENVSFTLRESFRVKLIAKIKAGEASMDFTVVDPKYPPVPTAVSGDFDASILFIPVNGTFKRTRADWKRVKSYDERLQVKIGPLQLMDF